MGKKFIVTADIHIWIRKDVPEAWQLNRYEMLFKLLIDLCLKHRASLIIAGDLFEKAKPNLQEINLALRFFRLLKEAGIKVFLISGNHETIAESTADKKGVDTFQHLDAGPELTVSVNYGDIYQHLVESERTIIHFVNHCDLKRGLQYMQDHEPETTSLQHILISHFRCNLNQFVKEEIDVATLCRPYDLVIAGDIHAPHRDGKIWYTNHPVNKEFERNPETGVILLTVDRGRSEVERIETRLPNLVHVECDVADYPPKVNPEDFCKITVTGRPAELRQLAHDRQQTLLVPVPVMDEVLAERTQTEEELKDVPLEEDLIAYMRDDLKYSEAMTAEMVAEFRVN